MDNDKNLREEHLRGIADNIIELLLKKNEDYGGASFDLGLTGNMVHLWDKTSRYRSLVEKKIASGGKPNFESIKDTLLDIAGYAFIGLTILERENTSN